MDVGVPSPRDQTGHGSAQAYYVIRKGGDFRARSRASPVDLEFSPRNDDRKNGRPFVHEEMALTAIFFVQPCKMIDQRDRAHQKPES